MHRSCPPTAAQGSQQQSMLELLPTELLPVIAKDCLLGDPGSNGHRMLGVCRACRQAVLSCLKNAKLGLDEDSSIQPLARLLHRICSQASPGLGVELDLVEQHRALPLLIQPGLQCGGWSNVTALKVNSKSTWAFNLVPLAFPALTTLELDVDGVRLREPVVALLQQCRTLSSLSICGYTLDDEGTPAIAAAVAQLSSLRDLTLLPADYYEDLSPALIAAAVSSLTALRLPADCGNHFQEGTLTAVAHNPGLKTLRIHAIQEYPTAAQLAQLLAAVPSLTELDMPETLLDDQGVEAVLTHGSNITSLNVLSIKVETSFVDQPCNWQKLSVEDCYEQPSVLMLAHLPLRKVNDLHIWSSNLPELQLPLGRAPHAQLPAILRQAATNLASCPAWQAGFKGSISLTGGPGPALPNRVVFDGRQRIQLIKALAPLGSPALKQMQVSIDGAVFQWGRSEVRALARSLGGQVASLQLGDCTLQPDFWLALDECFPALTFLRLQQDVTCSPPDAALFCGARPADRPFTLSLHNEVYVDINGQQLRGSLAARGVAHVKVMRAPRT